MSVEYEPEVADGCRGIASWSDRRNCIRNVWNWRRRDFGADSGLVAGVQPAPGTRNKSGGADSADGIAGGDRVRARGICVVANGIAADSGAFPGGNRGRQPGEKNSFGKYASDFCGTDVTAGNIANRERVARMTGPQNHG